MFFLTPRPVDPLNGEGDLEFPLCKLLVFTEHKDTIRRGGVASTMKSVHAESEALNVPDSCYQKLRVLHSGSSRHAITRE